MLKDAQRFPWYHRKYSPCFTKREWLWQYLALDQTFAMFWMFYSFVWVIPRRRNFMFRRFGTLCSIFIGDVSKKNNRDEIARVLYHQWRWDRVFRNFGIWNSDAGKSPKRRNRTYQSLISLCSWNSKVGCPWLTCECMLRNVNSNTKTDIRITDFCQITSRSLVEMLWRLTGSCCFDSHGRPDE